MNGSQSSKIIVLGSYNVDLLTSVKEFPKPGDTVLGLGFHQGHGGKGSNQAIAVKRLGGNPAFTCCVGVDDFGKDAMRMFNDEGIDFQHVLMDPTFSTGTAFITVDKTGENQIVVNSGANHCLLPDYIDQNLDFEGIGWLLVQLEVPFETVKRAVELASEKGVNILLNPAPISKDILPILPLIDVLTPNEAEAEVLTGIPVNTLEDAKEAAKWILDKGSKAVAITLGADGVFIAEDSNEGFVSKHIPAIKLNPIDTTGAGDCFSGALVVALSEGKSFEEGAEFAVKAAAKSVRKRGAAESMPFRSELD